MPSFISQYGPVREARFVQNADGIPDGGVHALFTIAGPPGAPAGCTIDQPVLATEVANHNVIFRTQTPVFGAGLIEQIPDAAILANQATNSSTKAALGVRGRPNTVDSFSSIEKFAIFMRFLPPPAACNIAQPSPARTLARIGPRGPNL